MKYNYITIFNNNKYISKESLSLHVLFPILSPVLLNRTVMPAEEAVTYAFKPKLK